MPLPDVRLKLPNGDNHDVRMEMTATQFLVMADQWADRNDRNASLPPFRDRGTDIPTHGRGRISRRDRSDLLDHHPGKVRVQKGA